MRDAPGSNIKWKLFNTGVHKSWKPGYQATKFCRAMPCTLGSKVCNFLCHPFGDKNFEVATPFFENTWTSDLTCKIKNKTKV